MVTEEDGNPPSPYANASSPALPPYPEMIMAAIDAINDKNGANKAAISKYVESNYENLPEGHSMLLAHHLNKMKDAGELSFAKNSYMRPDPNSPPKRGRGRPPKAKTPLPEGYASLSSPRPRGRPPKPKDSLVPKVKKVAPVRAPTGPPRPRGRPPKKGRPAAALAPAPAPTPAAAATPPSGVKRGRGRPPKLKPTVAAVGA